MKPEGVSKPSEALYEFSQGEHEKSSRFSHEKLQKYKKNAFVLVPIFLGYFNLGITIAIQVPFFPPLAESKNVSPSQFGLVFSVYQLSMFLAAPLAGKMLSDVRPKAMVNCGVLTIAITSVLFSLLDKSPPGLTFFTLAVIIRVAEGIGAATIKTAAATIITAHFSDSVPTAFSALESSLGFGLIFGPSIAGVFYEIGGHHLIFILTGIFAFFNTLVIFFFLPQIESKAIKKKSISLTSFLANPSIILDAFIIFATCNAIGFNYSTLEPHLRQFNLSAIHLGLVVEIAAGMYALSNPVWGKICSLGVTPRLLNIFAGLFHLAGFLTIGPASFFHVKTELWMVILALILFGIGNGTQICAFISALRTTKERGFEDDISTYAVVSAFFATFHALGHMVGPSLGGILIDTVGYKKGTLVIVGIFCVVLILASTHYVCDRRKRSKENTEKKTLLSH